MIENKIRKTERAILVALRTKEKSREIVSEHLDELEELATTAGADAIIKIVQDKHTADPAFYIGKGKAQEIAELVELNEIDIVIFDDDLSPVQVRNLEKLIERKIIDRSGLILDIFAFRARTKEAKTQVELAQYEYLLPRLTGAWTHLSKQYGGIGTKGPGETQIETDRRIVRDRISHLKEKLQKIESQRQIQTQGRKDIVRVSIAGYTNAGKSTLFNILTKEDVFAEDKLFATLDSTTRMLELDKNTKILLSDTVGFIRKLPHHLVASFKSTLNEVRDADIILHIIDVSHKFYEDHLLVVDETLRELECDKKFQIKVFNKVDLLEDKSKIEYILNTYENSVIISASRGINVSALIEMMKKFIKSEFEESKVILHISDTKTAAKIHSLAQVISTKYVGEKLYITYKADKENSEKIKRLVAVKR
jgi:GTP-binding protein HflX